MLFNSAHFLFFFPAVVLAYYLIPPRYRRILLLVASYYFYMCWKPEYAVLIAISTLVDYVAALRMAALDDPRGRRKYLVLSLVTNLGLLFTFKYLDFFSDSVRVALERFDIFHGVPAFDLLLPVGISFYTFQTLSYTIDVYRGEIEPERNLAVFALYVSFWPQLVAGPIERASRLIPRLKVEVSWDADRVREGLLRIAWGFYKKVVIADRLAVYVNAVYGDPAAYDGASLLLATYFFAFQIYCDFSGYSDIAIGAGRVLGIDLMENFKRPYSSQSISEFWGRWHISLSTWFRDYVYIPLGGNRVVRWRWYYNLMITFVISGLWHGANWTFVFWGALHGGYLAFAGMTTGLRQLLGRPAEALGVAGTLRRVITFHLVLFGWVFFRAGSIRQAFGIVGRILTGPWRLDLVVEYGIFPVAFASFLIVLLLLQEALLGDRPIEQVLLAKPRTVRWACYTAIACSILWFGVFTSREFIYFQF